MLNNLFHSALNDIENNYQAEDNGSLATLDTLQTLPGTEVPKVEDNTSTLLDSSNSTISTTNGTPKPIEITNSIMQDKPNNFKLAKRVGSKLNYNESDTEVADYFSSIESGGDYNARNKKSSAFGKYQVVKGTLVEKAKDLGISVKEARTPEGQEMVMHSLLGDYKNRLKEFDLPVTKENMFVLHNLGQTGGVRVLRGTYTGEDIKAMRANVSSDERSLPPKELVKAYTNRYNITIPPKQEI